NAPRNAAKNFFILFRCFLLDGFRFRRFSFCSLLCRSRFRNLHEHFLDPADINIHRQARDQLSDHFQRHILKLLEPHATPCPCRTSCPRPSTLSRTTPSTSDRRNSTSN